MMDEGNVLSVQVHLVLDKLDEYVPPTFWEDSDDMKDMVEALESDSWMEIEAYARRFVDDKENRTPRRIMDDGVQTLSTLLWRHRLAILTFLQMMIAEHYSSN